MKLDKEASKKAGIKVYRTEEKKIEKVEKSEKKKKSHLFEENKEEDSVGFRDEE